jgi:glutathione synthase/RimK-type ligase-like ATP-grasp enzyme
MRKIVVTNNPADLDFYRQDIEIAAAKSYLTESKYAEIESARIFNLCKSYRYQSTGYYVSLLAEARGHRAFPNISTIQDLKSKTLIRIISDDIEELIQKSLSKIQSKDFTLSIYFGKNIAKQYDKLCSQLYNLFQAPLLRAKFFYDKKWILQSISPISLVDIPENHKPYVVEFARSYFSKKRYSSSKIPRANYDLAILFNEEDKLPPSDIKAIDKFIEAGESIGIRTEIIEKDDFSRIPEFDALFIRETTAVNNHTYRFSRRAFAEGLVVIDDPWSILQCTNKVYLAELLGKAKVPTPKTVIVHKDNIQFVEKAIGLPCVLKRPDSSFSQGVTKVSDRETLKKELEKLLDSSDLIIAQEFTPTDFDWRIGILDKTPLFACKYYMAKNHWQIYDWNEKEDSNYGNFETLSIKKVPQRVVDTAVKAANQIGDGLYGVDLKQKGDKVFVIEVNDNPSIEFGVEDLKLKDKLYFAVMQSFKNRIDKIRKVKELHL